MTFVTFAGAETADGTPVGAAEGVAVGPAVGIAVGVAVGGTYWDTKRLYMLVPTASWPSTSAFVAPITHTAGVAGAVTIPAPIVTLILGGAIAAPMSAVDCKTPTALNFIRNMSIEPSFCSPLR